MTPRILFSNHPLRKAATYLCRKEAISLPTIPMGITLGTIFGRLMPNPNQPNPIRLVRRKQLDSGVSASQRQPDDGLQSWESIVFGANSGPGAPRDIPSYPKIELTNMEQGSKDSDMKELASLDNPNPYFIDPALPSSTESAVSEPKKQKKQYYLSKPLPRVHRLKPYARRYYHQTYNTGRSGLRKRLVFDTPSLQDLTLVSRRNDVLNISPNGFSLPEDVDILLSSGSSDWDAKTWTSTKSSSTGPTSPKRSEKTPSDEVEYTHCVDGRRVTLNEDEHDFPSIINDLTIVHPAYGKVEWNGPRYVPSLELIKNSASFQRKKISLFPNAELQPPPGQGLNQDIRVTVSGVGKWSRKKEKKLRACCNKNETNFVAFTKAGDWSFDVLCVG
ncbi:hypothetical protein AAMO2058_001488000 [Amorphochlora amoebiformis]